MDWPLRRKNNGRALAELLEDLRRRVIPEPQLHVVDERKGRAGGSAVV
jgi:hypothetical protein